VGSSTSSAATNPSAAEASSTEVITWQRVERIVASDPLVRSADVAAIRGEPFRIDQDQFPPPILFAEDAAESKPRRGDPKVPLGLTLKSTIVGASRRAAYINKKLYFEGTEIRGDDGRTYLLKAVHPRKVVLEEAGQTFELKIASRAPVVGAGKPRDVMDDVK
jgi:hypothetical protein